MDEKSEADDKKYPWPNVDALASLEAALLERSGELDNEDRVRILWYSLGLGVGRQEIDTLLERVKRLKETLSSCMIPIAALAIDERNAMLLHSEMWTAIRAADEKLRALGGL